LSASIPSSLQNSLVRCEEFQNLDDLVPPPVDWNLAGFVWICEDLALRIAMITQVFPDFPSICFSCTNIFCRIAIFESTKFHDMDEQRNLRASNMMKDRIGISRASEIMPGKWRFLNFGYLENIAPGNHTFFAEILQVFQSESDTFLQKISDQLRANDFFSLARTAHAMKPTGAYIGAEELTNLIRSLEVEARKADATNIPSLMTEIRGVIAIVNNEIEEYLNLSK
jgi:HPt (histidine-containing phosphotransfer) domain-containing protein